MIDPHRIWKSSRLPSIPLVAIRLLEYAKDPSIEIKEVVTVIKSDPAISAKILKAANSAAFGFQTRIPTIERAVPLLGPRLITSLTLTFSLTKDASLVGPLSQHYKSYWLQSITQAVASEVLGIKESNGTDGGYFVGGLLTDLGRLAMLKTIPSEYLPVLQKADSNLHCLHDVESDILGFNHIDIGVQLMNKWAFPDGLVDSVRLHHGTAPEILQCRDMPHFDLIRSVALGSAIGELFRTESPGMALQRLTYQAHQICGLSDTEVGDVLRKTRDRVSVAGELVSVDTSQLPDVAELMSQAAEQLAELAVADYSSVETMIHKLESDNKDLVSQNATLREQSVRDGLTKVYNRRFFDEAVQMVLNRCRSQSVTIGLLFIDVDRFKQLNDHFGHQFGDLVLKRVTTAIARVTRSGDVLARYGGEEFAILASDITVEELRDLAERVRARVEAEDIRSGDKRVSVTVSVGGSIVVPRRHDTEFSQWFIATADAAMYQCKLNGRNRVEVCSPLDDDSEPGEDMKVVSVTCSHPLT